MYCTFDRPAHRIGLAAGVISCWLSGIARAAWYFNTASPWWRDGGHGTRKRAPVCRCQAKPTSERHPVTTAQEMGL